MRFILFWVILWTPQVWSEIQTELRCVHLIPIQMRFLQRHVSFNKLTSEIQARTVDQFVKRIDPSKLYLLEPDVENIRENLKDIFIKTSRGDCQALLDANAILVRRVEERVKFARSYVGDQFKLNKSARYTPNPDNRERPDTLEKANEAYKAQLQWEVANYMINDISLGGAKKYVLQGQERILRRVQKLKPKDILANYLDIYANALDPHSDYMSSEAVEDFEIQMRLSLDGIGATLGWKNGFTSIEHLVPGGAAAASKKLKRGDKIMAVAQGEDGPFEDIIDKELSEVVRLIRGPKGTSVRIQILRKKGKDKQRFEITLVRSKVKLEDSAASIHYVNRDEGSQKYKVALLHLPSFYHDDRADGPSATSDLKKLLNEAKKAKVDAVVLDLAGNGGGSMPDAVDVAGLFLASGNVLKVGMRDRPDDLGLLYQTYSDTDTSVDWSGPLVVLTNRETASSSEIVSQALQDYQRAVIVGADHTFGKGTMQTLEGLIPGLGATKTTRGLFFTAGGHSTQHRGVVGDIVLPSIFSQDQIGEKTLDYSLAPKTIKPFLSPSANNLEDAEKETWVPIEKTVIDKLRKKSKMRVAKSVEFKKIKEELRKIKRGEKTVLVGSLFKDKPHNPKASESDLEEEESKPSPTKAERIKAYLSRADVMEGISVAVDLVAELQAPRGPTSLQGPPKAD